MAPRSLKTLASLTLVSTVAFVSTIADAQAGKKDKEAQKLITQALDEDYLGLELDKAESKLKKALTICGKDNCSPEVVGKIHVALATVHGVGMKKLDVAKADLVNALKADPKAALVAGLDPPELQAKFKEAQAEVGDGTGGEGGEGGDGGEGGEGGEGGKGPSPAGDFNHTPVAEQAVNTPVPVFAEIPEDLGATKVIVRYKPYGGTKWESLLLKKLDEGFGGLIPCEAVTTTGKLRYYIIGTDETGTPVATAGSLKQPFEVPIRNKIKGDKPSLPGEDPPKKCIAKGECPPGLPGCESSGRGDKPEGSSCDQNQECSVGLICLNGVCTPGEEPKTGGGDKPWNTKGAHHYLSLTGQLDIAYVGSGENVCSAASSASYVCTIRDSDGDQFFGIPQKVKGTNGISGGLAFAGARLMLGYDFEFDFDVVGLGIGARVGYAFSGPSLSDKGIPDRDEDGEPDFKYPKGNSFLPVHAEGRVQLRFVNPSMQGGDFAPHAFIGGGGAQVNAAIPVTVCDSEAAEPGESGTCPGKTEVDAYQLTGLSFFSFGGGVTYMIVDNFGISGDVKFMVMFPTVGFVIAPTISPVVAF